MKLAPKPDNAQIGRLIQPIVETFVSFRAARRNLPQNLRARLFDQVGNPSCLGLVIGIVDESGSGKSVTCMAVLRLLREPPARISADKMELGGINILRADRKALVALRGRVAAMVFQDPMTAFDPVFTIGQQISETILAHHHMSASAARTEAGSLLRKVEIKNPAAVLDAYLISEIAYAWLNPRIRVGGRKG